MSLPDLPGVVLADAAPVASRRKRPRFDEGLRVGVAVWPPDRRLPPAGGYVSAVDGDGNETAGVRLPELAVPIRMTYSAWNSPRHRGNRQASAP